MFRSIPSRYLKPVWLIATTCAGTLSCAHAGPAPLKVNAPQLSRALQQLTRHVAPAIVQVRVSGHPGFARFGRRSFPPQTFTERGAGSGVIVAASGIIVTNAHVVDRARRVEVLVSAPAKVEGRQSILGQPARRYRARVLGIDRESDLAVLKIEALGLPALRLADSDYLAQGELVMAFGSPHGLQDSVSMGIVSSVARQLKPDHPMVYIQTDATVNPGNSGGALVNTEGDVVGINTFILSSSGGSDGLSFAVPSNIVRHVLQQIRKHGRVRRGIIGLHAQTISPRIAKALKLSVNWGVIAGDVYPGSPAALAGLLPGDIVLALDDKAMENARQLNVNLYRRSVGDHVTLSVLRGRQRLRFKVAIVERRDDPRRFAALVSPEKNLISPLGILAVDLAAGVRKMMPRLRIKSGVLVAAVSDAELRFDRPLRPGDVIHAVNNDSVTSMSELRQKLAGLDARSPVVLQVERQQRLLLLDAEAKP